MEKMRVAGRKMHPIVFGALALVVALVASGCETPATSTTGVKRVNAEVQVDAQGMTVEQRNIAKRLKEDNKPGAIKHLYIISAYSGQVILYSTVDGKVTSSGKRLSPYTVQEDGQGFQVFFGEGAWRNTSEVLQDDGTYGSSAEYIYWWDVRGVYHQHYIAGGQIVHISDQPIAVKGIIINLEVTQK